MNHAQYEERIRFVDTVLRDKFHLTPLLIEPIAYVADCPFPFNNYVYKLSVSRSAASPDSAAPRSVGVSARLPIGTEPFTLIMRLSNPLADGMNNTNRVQNEVATTALMRSALAARGLAHLVPAVYGWGALNPQHGWGWILQQHMPGIAPDEGWDALPSADKRAVLAQMAEVLKALQDLPLPASVAGYGGLTFGAGGAIVGGAMTLVPDGDAGPYASYAALVQAGIATALADADKSPALRGWPTVLRARVDAFTGALPRVLAGVDLGKKTLVHADFTANNLLWDPATRRLTAVLDFDWAYVGTVGDEFLRSLRGIGNVPGPYAEEEDQRALRTALLSGVFPEPLPEAGEGGVNWEVARVWEECLRDVGAQRPSTIAGMEVLSGLQWLGESIAPFALTHPVMLKRTGEEKQAEIKAQHERWLVAYLESYGF